MSSKDRLWDNQHNPDEETALDYAHIDPDDGLDELVSVNDLTGELPDSQQENHRVRPAGSKDVAAWFHHGVSAANREHWDEARDAFLQAYHLEPSPRSLHAVWIQCGLAYCCIQLEWWDKAEEYLGEATKLDDANIHVLAMRSVVMGATGRNSEAIELLEAYLQRRPESVGGWFNLGNAWLHLHGLDEAQKAYQRGLDIDPSHVSIRNNLGICLVEAGQPGEAVKCMKVCLEDAPPGDNAILNYARACLKHGNSAKAIEVLESLLLERNNEPEIYILLARACYAEGRFLEAVDTLGRCVYFGEYEARAEEIKGMARLKLDSPGQAMEDWTRALECQPDFPRVRERIARLHLKESRLDDAFKHIKIATTGDAWRLSAWLLKAKIAEEMMDNAEQEAALGQIIKIDQDHAQARFKLGVLLFNRQRSKGAQKQLKYLQTLGSPLADELSDLMESGGVR